MRNIIDTVGVYGTLKQRHHNSSVMWMARGELVWTDYIKVDSLWAHGFPMVKLSDKGNKWLLVEIYNVPIDWIRWPLDSLEWYSEWGEYNFYNRVKVETESGREIWVYEYVWDVQDRLEEFYTHNNGENLYYNWK